MSPVLLFYAPYLDKVLGMDISVTCDCLVRDSQVFSFSKKILLTGLRENFFVIITVHVQPVARSAHTAGDLEKHISSSCIQTKRNKGFNY